MGHTGHQETCWVNGDNLTARCIFRPQSHHLDLSRYGRGHTIYWDRNVLALRGQTYRTTTHGIFSVTFTVRRSTPIRFTTETDIRIKLSAPISLSVEVIRIFHRDSGKEVLRLGLNIRRSTLLCSFNQEKPSAFGESDLSIELDNENTFGGLEIRFGNVYRSGSVPVYIRRSGFSKDILYFQTSFGRGKRFTFQPMKVPWFHLSRKWKWNIACGSTSCQQRAGRQMNIRDMLQPISDYRVAQRMVSSFSLDLHLICSRHIRAGYRVSEKTIGWIGTFLLSADWILCRSWRDQVHQYTFEFSRSR